MQAHRLVILVGLAFVGCGGEVDSDVSQPLSCSASVSPAIGPPTVTFEGTVVAPNRPGQCTFSIDGQAALPTDCSSVAFSLRGSQIGVGAHVLSVNVLRDGSSATCSASWVVQGPAPHDLGTDANLGTDADMAHGPTDMATTPPDLFVPFNPAEVTILNSPQDVFSSAWSVTTSITQVDLRPNGIKFNFSKKATMCDNSVYEPTTISPGSWPDVPYGVNGSIEYTFWMFELINGKWYGAANLEFWCDLDRYPASPAALATGGFYDPGRWGPLANRVPAVGELVGFMVTQGDARNNGPCPLKERSNVVFLPFPADALGGTFNF